MTNKYKKEREEYNRRIYNNKSLPELKIIGKKKGLLNVDQYKKANKNVLLERLVKGRQLSDENKSVLLEKAKNENLKVYDSMSKNVILQKITNPKLTDLNEKRLRKLAEKKGIPLRSQMTNREIIQRLENPTDYYTVESLKRLARSNNINVRRTISKPELINILGERNLITTTPITAQESNLGVMVSNVPMEIIRKAKKKAQSAREALINFKEYIIRNRVNVKLVNTKEKLRKLVAKPNFKSCKIFSENLVSVHMKKTNLTMIKPVYLGMCILDLSKTIMYDFYYNYIKKKYGDKAKLLFSDTDSLMCEIQTEDFYKDISGDVKDRFDTSDYPENHPSGIPTGINKKVLGMMKDEAAGKIIKEFVGLRAKLYSYKMYEGEEEIKKCKGIKKQVVESSISHEDYKTCLLTGKEQLRKQNMLRSYNHEVYTEEVNKVALSALDDKRYILKDGIHTLAWGHYKIKDI